MRKILVDSGIIDKGRAWNANALPQYREKASTEWMAEGVCKGGDTTVFFPHREDDSKAARRDFCSRCPVQRDCFSYAVENRIKDGIWGGHGVRGRRRIMRGIRAGNLTLEDL